jgi:hypothetical protein
VDENLYRCLKQIEIAMSNAQLSLPIEGSVSFKAINIQPWKIGALASLLGELQDATRKAGVVVYMEGKD